MALAAPFPSCLTLTAKLSTLSLNNYSNVPSSTQNFSSFTFRPLSFSAHISHSHRLFSGGSLSVSTTAWRRRPIRPSVVCEAAPRRKADSAAKRARQSEKRRIYNKARKSEIRTRMRKVLEALDHLRKKPDAQAEEIFPIEKLIAEAYSVIDKAVKVGTLHRKTGANRKSRLARRKKAVEIHRGWYTPVPAAAAV